MLRDSNVIATIAVNDIVQGKKFYGEVLGLTQTDENKGGVTYACGSGRLFVYGSPTAGSGKATCANWEVEDIKAVVGDLKSKNLSFEHYEWPGAEHDGDVHVMDGMKAAWFKDPDGNILGLSQL